MGCQLRCCQRQFHCSTDHFIHQHPPMLLEQSNNCIKTTHNWQICVILAAARHQLTSRGSGTVCGQHATKMSHYFSAFVLVALSLISAHSLGQVLEAQPINSSPTAAPLGCHQRLYTYRITQADELGRECWDYVNVRSCWGRCDSSEISDWKFPYKRSFHPVCVHADRQAAVVELKNCHPDASEEARRYEYMEAVSCHCHTCSSLDTSCEAPANNILDERTSVKVLALTGSDSEALDY